MLDSATRRAARGRRFLHYDRETASMDQATIERDIRDFLTENFPLADEGTGLAENDSLIEAGVIDSTGVLELIEYLEANYGIQISDEEVLPENLDSIARIGRFVTTKITGGGDGRAADSVA